MSSHLFQFGNIYSKKFIQIFINTGKNKEGETGKESSDTEGQWVLKSIVLEM